MAVILIVDADTSLLSTLGLFIAAEGYVVRTATNGADALNLARASRPDVLVTDTRTPGIAGPDLVREMRKDPVLSTVPVILTYNGALPPRVRVYRFLRKPLRYAKLLKILRRAERVCAKQRVRERPANWRLGRRASQYDLQRELQHDPRHDLKHEPKPG
ncbi:MAG TPA: response regulator [Paraburkholderia sp.]|jgi:DNA-binding NtrC family response regulator|nr:response regulator [Paraburkholderia sp.]